MTVSSSPQASFEQRPFHSNSSAQERKEASIFNLFLSMFPSRHGLRKWLVCFNTSTTWRLSALGKQSCSIHLQPGRAMGKAVPTTTKDLYPLWWTEPSPGMWLSHLPIEICGFFLQNSSSGSGVVKRVILSETRAATVFTWCTSSFSSINPWRHQVSVMGQRLCFYGELIESNVEQRCSVFFAHFQEGMACRFLT